MPTVLAYHDVTDTDHWLASPKREELSAHILRDEHSDVG